MPVLTTRPPCCPWLTYTAEIHRHHGSPRSLSLSASVALRPSLKASFSDSAESYICLPCSFAGSTICLSRFTLLIHDEPSFPPCLCWGRKVNPRRPVENYNWHAKRSRFSLRKNDNPKTVSSEFSIKNGKSHLWWWLQLSLGSSVLHCRTWHFRII